MEKTNENVIRQEINEQLRRGEIYYADLCGGVLGSEQGGIRPVLIIQNDKGNKFSSTTIIAPITSQMSKSRLPTHISVTKNDSGLPKDSVVLMEQIRIIDKCRLTHRVGCLNDCQMQDINAAICISLGLQNTIKLAPVAV